MGAPGHLADTPSVLSLLLFLSGQRMPGPQLQSKAWVFDSVGPAQPLNLVPTPSHSSPGDLGASVEVQGAHRAQDLDAAHVLEKRDK